MTILDSKGRLFGKINILDLGAALVILLVIVGIFLFPGGAGSVAQVGGKTVPIEVDLVVRGLNILDTEQLYTQGFTKGGKTNVIIRNQPYGQINIKSVEELPRTTLVPQPDGSVKDLPEPPRANNFSKDLRLTLAGTAKITDQGPVLGNSKVKIGMPIELDGFNYNFNATVIDVRLKDK
ncbi:pyruvate/2-oxoglutarate dehydrogenase complex,dihydrolipoamide dehydrogenase (E3) component [Nostocales cyanobacterium HT-58-2]|nr:pyruvate/2-oxoglutarate dehydrogenase complex,dihydrolipoamide dehydrogenase (E3) component [Nostocales cyanobacterium HT-58-2]